MSVIFIVLGFVFGVIVGIRWAYSDIEKTLAKLKQLNKK